MKSIAKTAKLGTNVSIGEFVVIEDDVIIGDNCIIGHHVVIHRGSIIGNNVRIDDHAVIGKQPMRAALSIFKGRDVEEKPPCRIGDECLLVLRQLFMRFSTGQRLHGWRLGHCARGCNHR